VFDLGVAQPRIEREPEQAVGDVLGHRAAARRGPAQPPAGRGVVQRLVVERGLDAVLGEVPQHRLALLQVRQQQVVQVRGVLAAGGHDRQAHARLGRPFRQPGVVRVPHRVPPALDLGERLQLRGESGREHVRRQIAGSHVHPPVLVDLPTEEPAPVGPLLAEDLGPLAQRVVVEHQRAALAALDVLGRVEALRGERSDRAQRSSPVVGAETVGVVLDHR
jgi:hypothetical protein